MTVNTRNKGRRAELRARDILEAAGYQVELTKSPSKWSKQQDMFGLWDLIAIRGSDVRFVQVKSNKKVYGALREPYELWECPSCCCTKEIWVFYDGKPNEPLIEIL